MKKIAVAAAVAMVFGAAVFAEAKVSFVNKVSSGIVEFKNGDGTFAGITEKVGVDVELDKVTAGIDGRFILSPLPYTDKDGNNKKYQSFYWKGINGAADWYVTFQPWDFLTFGWSNPFWTEGSYLPVADDNLAQGDLGAGDGFDVLITPIENLRIGAGVNFESYLFRANDPSADSHNFHFNAGADFTVEDVVTVGVALNDIIENFGIGAYASITAIDSFTFNVGFAHQAGEAGWDGAVGDNALSAAVIFENDTFSLAAEVVTPFAVDNGYDLYSGASFSMGILDNLDLEVSATVLADFASKDDGGLGAEFDINPGIVFKLNDHHSFGAGVDIGFDTNNSSSFSLPVYWKYKL